MIKLSPSIQIISDNNYEDMAGRIELIGRVCYKSENAITETSRYKFIEALLRRGHESVIEHESISVKVVCDRGILAEITRHRIASYSVESSRYCNYSQDKFCGQISVIDLSTGFNYCLSNDKDFQKYKVWMKAMEFAENCYFKMLELGATPEEARSVLPNSLKTEIVMTMNLREWRHFLKLRTDKASHPQMREVADQILELFVKMFPAFFIDIKRAKKRETI